MDRLENKISFYRLLTEMPVGYKEDLEKEFEERKGLDFAEIYNSSLLVGILRAGIDGTFEERYKVTEFGKRQIVAFIELDDYLNS